jgi:hypothetical protein
MTFYYYTNNVLHNVGFTLNDAPQRLGGGRGWFKS